MKKSLPHWVAKAVIGVLLVVLAILGYSLWRQYSYIQHSHLISAERLQIMSLRHRGPLSASDVSYIGAWMTFDYISISFRVPEAYLKSALQIDDPLYPHLSISHYARDAKLDPNAVVTEVQTAVTGYLASSTQPAVIPAGATSTSP